MTEKVDKKTLRNDLILILSLFLIAAVSLVILISTRRKENLVAKIIANNDVVEVIDLSKKEENDYYIDGLKGTLHVHTHDGAIAVVESNCPHQDCVHMGYVSESGRPIICAYNAVYIAIEGDNTFFDAGLGS